MFDKGCEERCKCQNDGKWSCEPRCQGVFIQRGKMQSADPHCYERTTNDECCSTILCENETEIIDLGNEAIFGIVFFLINTGN